MNHQNVQHFHIGTSWLDVCSSTSCDFLEFNNIEVDTNILSMAGYNASVGQNWTTIIPSILSSSTFERTLGMTEIGENATNFKREQLIVSVSIYIASGSG